MSLIKETSGSIKAKTYFLKGSQRATSMSNAKSHRALTLKQVTGTSIMIKCQ